MILQFFSIGFCLSYVYFLGSSETVIEMFYVSGIYLAIVCVLSFIFDTESTKKYDRAYKKARRKIFFDLKNQGKYSEEEIDAFLDKHFNKYSFKTFMLIKEQITPKF